jgi:2'-5' RNA ligase
VPAYFIGLVPDGDLHERLTAFIERHAEPAAEPHVTVKAQTGLEDTSVWFAHLRRWASTYPAVEVPLEEPRFFGDEILYLSVGGETVHELHEALLAALAAVGITERFEYEGDAFVPHLTLSATWLGRCAEELAGLAEEARVRFPPTTFRARSLSVFRSLDGVTYERFESLPLA